MRRDVLEVRLIIVVRDLALGLVKSKLLTLILQLLQLWVNINYLIRIIFLFFFHLLFFWIQSLRSLAIYFWGHCATEYSLGLVRCYKLSLWLELRHCVNLLNLLVILSLRYRFPDFLLNGLSSRLSGGLLLNPLWIWDELPVWAYISSVDFSLFWTVLNWLGSVSLLDYFALNKVVIRLECSRGE